jgi:DNA-binding NtrC family response regulator
VIELKLKQRGYQVFEAKDGEEGLELIHKERPFLTLIITCRISLDERSWISKMQDTLFMEKPFSPSRLLECLDRYFGVAE